MIEMSAKNTDTVSDSIRDQYVSEGISNLFSRIGEVKVRKESREVSINADINEEERSNRLRAIAEAARSTYREKINPKFETRTDQPVTKAKIEIDKATIKSLTGGRSSGDAGRSVDVSGSSNKGLGRNVNTGLYPTSLTIEEYKDYIEQSFKKYDINTLSSSESEEVVEEVEDITENTYIDELKSGLLKLESTTWQDIDTLMRRIANEHDITPRQLHLEFKKAEGMIPDEWVKKYDVNEQCGWFPLEEAVRLNRVGLVYEVTFVYRGVSQRLKFFWPQVKRPTKTDMQREVAKFYPNAKLISFYPARDQGEATMVVVAPIKENFVPYQLEDWGFLSEEMTDVYDEICEEEGEPLTPPYLIDENTYEVIIEDYDTGEEAYIQFSEKADDNGNDKCWVGYIKKGLKKKGDKMVNNCVKEEGPVLSVGRGEKQSVEAGGGLTAKGRAKYNRSTGSNLKPPVTSDNPGPKDSARRKSFCARSRGWDGERGKAARRRWKC